jgi:RNA polymerase sigma-70 factor, ECF subfamily
MRAIEQEIRDNHADLRRFAYRMVGDAADDVLQEAYLKALRSWNRFLGAPSRRRPWLYRIVYHCAIDELRRRKPTSLDRIDHTTDSPDADLLIDFAGAFAGLPAPQRAAVLLVDMIGLNYDEAALVCGVPRGTVASRLSLARGALRRQLEQERLPL